MTIKQIWDLISSRREKIVNGDTVGADKIKSKLNRAGVWIKDTEHGTEWDFT
jgi:cysteinyl-tRNA synthetase